MFALSNLAVLLACTGISLAAEPLPSSSPHHYPGKPSFAYNASWQSYFEVTDPLPNISFALPRSYAGSLSTQTVGYANNSAFFWGFEKQNGSLTQASSLPWGLWLAGGPGYSSIAGMLLENGPISATKTGWEYRNTSMHQLADWFWVDAPVGVGYATVAEGGYATSEEQMASDFWGFISNLVHVFPHLKKRPLYISGESYAGRFIPYIMKSYFSMSDDQRPTRLAKVACSNPGLQSTDAFEQVPITRVIETYPQLIDYNTGFYDYVREQSHLCKLDLNLTYPQTGGKFPSIHIKYGAIGHRLGSGQQLAVDQPLPLGADIANRKRALDADATWMEKRVGLPPFNSTLTGKINKFFGCDVRDLVLTYAFNYSMPWTVLAPEFDYLDIPNTVNPLKLLLHPHHWMNNNVTRNALHAPYNAIWRVTILQYPWGSRAGGQDPSEAPMGFMDELAANASANGVGMLWYSGNDDALTTHFSTEVAIQNTTFGGIQGFTVPPNTPWYDDSGAFAGTIRQERNWTLAILYGTGHQTPVDDTRGLTYTLMRDFFLGNSTVGLVETASDGTTKIHTAASPEGAAATPTMLPDGVMPGQTDIYMHDNKVATQWPQATRAAWTSHVAKVLATPTATHSA